MSRILINRNAHGNKIQLYNFDVANISTSFECSIEKIKFSQLYIISTFTSMCIHI